VTTGLEGGVAAKVPLATVYQKHRSLLTRKRMYRGWGLTSAGTLISLVHAARYGLSGWSASKRPR